MLTASTSSTHMNAEKIGLDPNNSSAKRARQEGHSELNSRSIHISMIHPCDDHHISCTGDQRPPQLAHLFASLSMHLSPQIARACRLQCRACPRSETCRGSRTSWLATESDNPQEAVLLKPWLGTKRERPHFWPIERAETAAPEKRLTARLFPTTNPAVRSAAEYFAVAAMAGTW